MSQFCLKVIRVGHVAFLSNDEMRPHCTTPKRRAQTMNH